MHILILADAAEGVHVSGQSFFNWLTENLFYGLEGFEWFSNWYIVALALLVVILLLLLALLLLTGNSRSGMYASDQPVTRTDPVDTLMTDIGSESTLDMSGTARSLPKRLPGSWDIANVYCIGSRESQQDSYAVSPLNEVGERGLLMVLCDGMGGMADGAVISQKAVAAAMEAFRQRVPTITEWERIIRNINRDIHNVHKGAGGTTLVLAYVYSGYLWFITAGDSDLFLLRDNRIYAVNTRHEYVNDLIMRSLAGEMSLKEAFSDRQAGALLSFIGTDDGGLSLDVSNMPYALKPGDGLLLCSDGISDTLDLAALRSCLMKPAQECAAELERLVTAAARPYQDNYTAIIAKFNA